MDENQITSAYKLISKEIDEWLEIHRGETFDLDAVCKQLNIINSKSRKYAAMKLSNEAKAGRLDKTNKTYRYVDDTVALLNDWVTKEPEKHLDIDWPVGVNDNSKFGFDGHIEIPEKGLIIIAGVTNTGKSAFLRNVLWMNMRSYHCTYFSSETSAEDFADYASRMTWADPLDEHGKPVFDLVDRYKDWQDVIRPNDINIVDWLNLGDNFYRLGEILHGMKKKLDHGALFVAIQKDANKELGMGGQWGEHLASLYLTMDFERLHCKKAKKWCQENPNGQTWGFSIIDRGAHFHNIRPLKKCGFCFQGKKAGQECVKCRGTGWIDEFDC